MDDFDTGILQDSAHDVNGCVMAIEKRGGGNDAYMIFGFVDLGLSCHFASLVPYKKHVCRYGSSVSSKEKAVHKPI
jgi:hypothetical protein